MTVATTTARNVRDGNGVSDTFVYDFLILSSAHLEVYKLIGSTLTLLTETVDYIVTGVGNSGGGTVVFTVIPASVPVGTGSIVLRRNVPMTQGVHYVANDAFPEVTHEGALDKLTMLVQQVADASSLAVKVPLNYTGNTDDLLSQIQGSVIDANIAAAAADASAAAASSSASAAAASASAAQGAVGGVFVSAGDTTTGKLEAKLVAAPGVIVTKLNSGSNEQLSIGSVGATILLASKLGAL